MKNVLNENSILQLYNPLKRNDYCGCQAKFPWDHFGREYYADLQTVILWFLYFKGPVHLKKNLVWIGPVLVTDFKNRVENRSNILGNSRYSWICISAKQTWRKVELITLSVRDHLSHKNFNYRERMPVFYWFSGPIKTINSKNSILSTRSFHRSSQIANLLAKNGRLGLTRIV